MGRWGLVLVLVAACGTGTPGASPTTPMPEPTSTPEPACEPPCQARLVLGDGRVLTAVDHDAFGTRISLSTGGFVILDGRTNSLRENGQGLVLAQVSGNTAEAVYPLELAPLQVLAPFGDGRIRGDHNTELLDDAIVMHGHAMVIGGLHTATATWTWDGTTYVEGPCQGDRDACP